MVGQALLANGQVKLAGLQHELSVEQAAHRQTELAVAKLETPTRIVADATTQLHMSAASPIELPYVSLSVPLPTPKVTPAPAPPPPTTSPTGAGRRCGRAIGVEHGQFERHDGARGPRAQRQPRRRRHRRRRREHLDPTRPWARARWFRPPEQFRNGDSAAPLRGQIAPRGGRFVPPIRRHGRRRPGRDRPAPEVPPARPARPARPGRGQPAVPRRPAACGGSARPLGHGSARTPIVHRPSPPGRVEGAVGRTARSRVGSG